MEAVAGGILGELTIDKAWIWVTSILLYPVFNRYVTEGLDRWQEGVDWLFSYTTLEVHETALVGNNWKDPAFEDIMLWLDVDLQKSTFRHLRVSEGEHGVDHFSLVPGSQYGTGLYVKHHLSRSRRVRLVFTLLEDEVGGNPDYGHASSKKCRLQVKILDSAVPPSKVVSELRRQAKEIRDKRRLIQVFSHAYGSWIGSPFDPAVSFDKLALSAAATDEIFGCMDDLTKHGKEIYEQTGNPMCRGILLHGPPGTGKTETVVAIAQKYRLNIYLLDLSQIGDNGELEQMMHDARDPCIILIDDIHRMIDMQSLKAADASTDMKSGPRMTLAGILGLVDGVRSHTFTNRVFAITTNDLEALDEPLRRSGRMDLQIELSYLTAETFAKLARIYHDEDEVSIAKEFDSLPWDQMKLTPADAIKIMKGTKCSSEIWKASIRSKLIVSSTEQNLASFVPSSKSNSD